MQCYWMMFDLNSNFTGNGKVDFQFLCMSVHIYSRFIFIEWKESD